MVGKRYRILETLGKGAFGTVYRAEVIGAGDFKKQVALKVLDYEGEAPEEIALRFRDEARILGLIRHRAVVGVDSLAELETGWAVVMEYVEGVNISAVVKYGLPPVRVVVAVIEEVASALHAAWTTVSDETREPLRLVHRDVKPANIRLTAQGEVKVLDFGVARAEFESREANTGAMRFGSLRYMAPESFDGIEGHTTDIFALGIVFGELLAGKRLDEPPKNPERYPAFLDAVTYAARERLGNAVDGALLELVLVLLSDMIAFQPEQRPSARLVEQECRELIGQLSGPTLREWTEDYVPALVEKMARRRAQKRKDDVSGSNSILVEKTTGATIEGSMPEVLHDRRVDGTDTRLSNTAEVATGVMAGAGLGAAAMTLILFGLVFAFVVYISPRPGDPVAFDDGEGVAALDGDKTEDPSVAVGEGDAPSEEIEDIPDFEFVRFVDPQDPTRTIVIASGQLSQSQGEADLVEVVDPEDSRRTIVIAKSSLSGEADAPPEAERGVVIRVPPAKEEPTEVTVRVPTRTPTPGPSQVAVPQPTAAAGGVVTVSGDATSVSFVTSGGGSYGTGDVPVGTYRIMAVFPGQQDAVQAGTFSVRDGQAVTVNCTAMMLRCSAR